ncbi:TauD/TfdA family dioxygenase, partial [Pseudomonas aeruginosa]|nr:TauD/TfdA family dioxygenase [Pseudomonas aeruginosa]
MSVSLPAPARADVPLQISALDAAFGAEVLGLDLGL